MSIIYNGTTIDKVIYNGTELDTVKYGNTEVHTSYKPYMDFLNVGDNTSSPISESDFLDKVCIKSCFDDINPSTNKPYAYSFIKKFVRIPSVRNVVWSIIGYNHDNTSYTFDLWANDYLYSGKKFNSIATTARYTTASILSDLDAIVDRFSSAVQNRMQVMEIDARDNLWTTDYDYRKIKLPSLTELCYTKWKTNGENIFRQGNPYLNFLSYPRIANQEYTDISRSLYASGSYFKCYWLRSTNNSASYTSAGAATIKIQNGSYGIYQAYQINNDMYIIPIIRIGI